MKWYKKQLDLLKVSQGAPSEPGIKTYAIGVKKAKPQIKNFRNPVAEGKKSRSKTDK